MICAVCRREGRGFGFDPSLIGLKGPVLHACSMRCLRVIARRRGAMIDPTPNERAAIRHGGEMGGEILDSLGRTGLAQLTEAEWLTFVEAIVTGYCDRLRELAGRDQGKIADASERAPFR
ncbi:MAG: DUF6511 domain-containing protein [Rhodospirillales bacterium]|nr:DUF6511 domain-containing protein [Rhodospirillales bacterium]